MSDLFRTLVAQTTQKLVCQLTQESAALDSASIKKKNDGRVNLFDISDAEVDCGSIFFPDPALGESLNWCVFLPNKPHSQDGIDAYELCEMLPSELSAEEFITRAHKLLLSRPVDPDGKIVFVQLMERELMSRRDVLGVLARSAEARKLGLRVIVMPSPSTWSARVALDGSERSRVFVRSAN